MEHNWWINTLVEPQKLVLHLITRILFDNTVVARASQPKKDANKQTHNYQYTSLQHTMIHSFAIPFKQPFSRVTTYDFLLTTVLYSRHWSKIKHMSTKFSRKGKGREDEFPCSG
jgi:hypothetical protein